MQTPSLRTARDYNRGLPAPIRWAHTAAAVIAKPFELLSRLAARHPDWAPPLLIALPLAALALPFDGPISRFFIRHPPSGDLKREIEALQQYGQAVSTILIALVIWLQDPARRPRLRQWAAALAIAFVAVFAIKTMVGRPRPGFADDPWMFLGPLGQYPLARGEGIHHAWELWAGLSSRLWSMPSSHTAYAFVMATFVGALYPRLRALVLALAIFVGLARIIVGAHYPSDVVVGCGLGLASARAALRRISPSPAAPQPG